MEVDLLDAYLVPLVWAAVALVAATGAARDRAVQVGLAITTLITVAGRIADGRPEHIAVLGGVAVVVAIAAGRLGDRATLAGAASLTVAAACFDLLDRSVGVESWGWLLVGGAAAVSAAIVLERRDADAMAETSIG